MTFFDINVREENKLCAFISFTGDSRLVFIWPQKASRARISSVLAPLLRGVLIGLLFVDALHLWPGEFLPTSLPSNLPISLPPVKCNIIEPRWFDNNWATIYIIIVYYKHLYFLTQYDFYYNILYTIFLINIKFILLCKHAWFLKLLLWRERNLTVKEKLQIKSLTKTKQFMLRMYCTIF